MNIKSYGAVTSTLFLVIAIVHLLRAIFGWEVVVNGVIIPLWLSWVGVILAGFLSYSGCCLSKKK